MKHRLLFLAISAATAMPSQAAPDPVYNRPAEEALRVFRKFSECTVQAHPKESAEVVLSNDTSDEIMQRHPSIVSPDCLDDGQLEIPSGDYIRYGLAEVLVRQEYSKGLPSDILQAVPLRYPAFDDSAYKPKRRTRPDEAAELAKRWRILVADRALAIYGECVVRANPAGALRVVLSAPGSPDEAAAFSAVHSALSTCLTQGQKVEFGKAMLRGALAVDLYRLAKAPRVSRETVRAN